MSEITSRCSYCFEAWPDGYPRTDVVRAHYARHDADRPTHLQTLTACFDADMEAARRIARESGPVSMPSDPTPARASLTPMELLREKVRELETWSDFSVEDRIAMHFELVICVFVLAQLQRVDADGWRRAVRKLEGYTVDQLNSLVSNAVHKTGFARHLLELIGQIVPADLPKSEACDLPKNEP